MFTEREVDQLRSLSNVSWLISVWIGWFSPALQSELKLEDLKAHYNSYIAASSAGHISVYNPVSIMSAFKTSSIQNFWVATGLLAMIIFVLQPTE